MKLSDRNLHDEMNGEKQGRGEKWKRNENGMVTKRQACLYMRQWAKDWKVGMKRCKKKKKKKKKSDTELKGR